MLLPIAALLQVVFNRPHNDSDIRHVNDDDKGRSVFF